MNRSSVKQLVRLVLSNTAILLASFPCETGMAEDKSIKSAGWTLRVENGDVYRGEIAKVEPNDGIAWDCQSFANPIHFPWSAVHAIERNQSTKASDPILQNEGEQIFAVEQHSGVTISGRLLAIDAHNIRMQVMGMGEQTVPLSDVKNILRIFSSSPQPVQVLQAEDWEQVLPAPKNGKATKWFLKAGEISTDTSGTTISQWATLPSLATMDIDVAWEQPTINWWLTIGEPRRIELQVRKLQNKDILNVTLLVENSRDADVSSVQIPLPRESHMSLRLLCDADKGAYVLMMDNQILGRIKGNPIERIVGRNKFSFTNTALGVLTLRDLRISDRPFAIPDATADLSPDLAEVMIRKRGTFLGKIEAAESPSQIKVRVANGNDASIPIEEIEKIEFAKDARQTDQTNPADLLNIELTNSMRFATDRAPSISYGDQQATSGNSVAGPYLRLHYAGGTVSVPWDEIDRVSRIRTTAHSPPQLPISTAPLLRLLTEHVVSTGFIDSVYVDNAGDRMLMWLPAGGSSPSPIHPLTDGTIDPLTSATAATGKNPPRTPVKAVVRADTPKNEKPLSRELNPEEPSLFLISGDCFPSKVLEGNQETLAFQASFFETTRVPANQVRGVRIVDYEGADAIDRATRTRLLTLPRIQRKDPPTHLVVARDGDIVRGRLIAFDRDEIRLEVRGEERKLAMKYVAEIISLEAAPDLPSSPPQDTIPDPNTKDPTPEPEPRGGLYQVLLDKGSRISIIPETVSRSELVGTHPLLGTCSLPWANITRLVLGKNISADASRGRFGKWKLTNAPDPKFVAEGTAEQNDAPVNTAHDRLLGKPAPDHDCSKLDGTPFRLADYRGKIVILDFWASWCGPCIKSMPRIHQISRDYIDAGVEAVFVNIEEPEDRVRALLERLDSVPTVALDTDGSFAKLFAVQAIPQTVVIDRDGTILKILVGSGDATEEDLVRLLNDLTKN